MRDGPTTRCSAAWARLVELEVIDRAVALDAEAFVALFRSAAVSASPRRGGARPARGERDACRCEDLGGRRRGDHVTARCRSATRIFGRCSWSSTTTFAAALQRVFLRAGRRPPSAAQQAADGPVGGALGYR